MAFAAIELLPALRAQLIGGALGYRGEVPRLCRGHVGQGYVGQEQA